MEKVEEAFNFIWHVDEMRSFGERFSRYLSALLVGPVLVFAALGLTATLLNMSLVRSVVEAEPLGGFVAVAGRVVPYLLVIGAFAFLYLFMPNAKVRPLPALVGGVIGGLLWQTAGWGFATFVAGSTRYTAIYSSFAILILFMIWLYLSWLVLLIGAAIAFYVQHPEYLRAAGASPEPSSRMREWLAIAAATLIGESFHAGSLPPTRAQLAHAIGAPDHLLVPVLDAMRRAGLLVCTHGQPPAYVPGRDTASITLDEVMRVVRSAGEARHFDAERWRLPVPARQAVERMEQAIDRALGPLTLASLASGDRPPHAAGADAPPGG
jgi:membrane protein